MAAATGAARLNVAIIEITPVMWEPSVEARV
jgi:hypothetical protein